MELRWVNKTTKEIGIVNVTDDDSKILGIVGYEHCEEDDFTDSELDGAIVEVWKPF